MNTSRWSTKHIIKMMLENRLVCFFGILLSIGFLFIVSITLCEVQHMSDGHYRVAVVEYHPVYYPPGTPAESILMDNVKHYSKMILENKNNLDMIVFPESTLTTTAIFKTRLSMLNCSTPVPNPSDGVDVCEAHTHFPQFFTDLACTAKKAKVYVVVNLIEQKLCYDKSYYGEFRQCSKDAWDFYNTDVVFDRKGRVVARYRKYHLFGEVWMNRTVNPDISTFKADFGIKFGLFTCFDILFRSPAMDLVKVYGIDSIIYPSMWYSELPFLTALQAQMQWAYEFNAVLLSAGANNCNGGSGGSGIFQGESGAIILDYSDTGESKVYTADIPKIKTLKTNFVSNEGNIDDLGRRMDKFYLMTENLNGYTMQLVNPLEKIVNSYFCHNEGKSELCCHFYIKREINERINSSAPHYTYHMVIKSGVRSFKGVATGGIDVCGIIACMDNSTESCAKRFPNYDDVTWPVTFTDISIRGNFSMERNKIQYPNSLLSSIRPLPTDSFEWKYKIHEQESLIERTMNLKKPQNRLFTFAIYGRDFSKDTNLKDNLMD